ncbi:hypothetical protein HKD37_02G005075 [Glycine soja]
MKNNSKAMEAKERRKRSCALSELSFYNGRTNILKQPASHVGDPWARQIANGNGDLALTDVLLHAALHCHGRLDLLHPQLLELASLTGGSLWHLHIAIRTGDLGSAWTYRHWLWRVAH